MACQGFKANQIGVERFLNLRYDGTDVAVMTPCPEDGNTSYAEVASDVHCLLWSLEPRCCLSQ